MYVLKMTSGSSLRRDGWQEQQSNRAFEGQEKAFYIIGAERHFDLRHPNFLDSFGTNELYGISERASGGWHEKSRT